jgi:uncharacterized membrane protein
MSRIRSIDVSRGAVMLLMAIDHVRVFSGVPAGGPTPGVFFTRWITNFVAPAFAFLAGTSAFFLGRKLADRRALSRYLLTRGLMLVLLELTILRVSWTFNLDYAHYLLAGVIWMLGWCMVLMAGLVRLPVPVIGAIGVGIIALHNVIDPFRRALIPVLQQSPWAWVVQLLYFGGPVHLGHDGPTLAVLYSIIPWIGVMAAGYAFGAILTRPAPERDRLCLTIGLSAIALFVVLRGFDLYGDPSHWRLSAAAIAKVPFRLPPPFLRFLNTVKYPASFLFLLMTLGPMIALLPLAERARGAVGRVLETYGRVPLFYYVLHIPLIHAAACIVSLIREGQVNPWLFTNHPMMNPEPPAGYTWSLPLLYLVFAVVIAALYVPCRWYAGVRTGARDRGSWLRYL